LPHPTSYHYFTPGKLSEFKVKAFMEAFSLVVSVIALNGTVSFDEIASALEKPQMDLSGNTEIFTMGQIARMLLLGVCKKLHLHSSLLSVRIAGFSSQALFAEPRSQFLTEQDPN